MKGKTQIVAVTLYLPERKRKLQRVMKTIKFF